jgi:hypothetical protein
VALVAAAAVLALGPARTARAQKPLVFEGGTATALSESHTRNGVPFFPPGLPPVIFDPFLVLFPDATFGFFPAAAARPGGPAGYPIYGQVEALPGGGMVLSGFDTPYQSGTTKGANSLRGLLFVAKGQFYAFLTFVGTVSSPATTGNGADTTVDVVSFVVPLTVVSH